MTMKCTRTSLICQLPKLPGSRNFIENYTMKKRFVILVICSWFIGSAVLAQPMGSVKNVVLVHGAFADGSGWEGVFKILTAKGYNVSVVQNPLMYGLEGD